jgi:broad specificity phosphatase PhoE
VLARHGKPKLPRPLPRISGAEIREWERRYDETGIGDALAPDRLHELAGNCGRILASNLRRSIESALRLAPASEVHIEPLLREARLPGSVGSSVRLPPRAWAAVGRIAWCLDLCASTETIDETRLRARRVAVALQELSERHGVVLVVGHGTFNRFVASALRRTGWRGPKVLPISYWSSARYQRSIAPG